MSEEYVPRSEHEEFCKRLDRENERQNERLKALERSIDDINRLAISTERLATNMEKMVEEQKLQGDRISKLEEKQDTRITKLEGRDGEKWREIVKTVVTVVVSAVIGAVLMMIGIK